MRLEEVLPAFRQGKKIKNGYLGQELHKDKTQDVVAVVGFLSDRWEVVEDNPKTKAVWQWRYRCTSDNLWQISSFLMTEEEASKWFGGVSKKEKHAGPFEVPYYD